MKKTVLMAVLLVLIGGLVSAQTGTIHNGSGTLIGYVDILRDNHFLITDTSGNTLVNVWTDGYADTHITTDASGRWLGTFGNGSINIYPRDTRPSALPFIGGYSPRTIIGWNVVLATFDERNIIDAASGRVIGQVRGVVTSYVNLVAAVHYFFVPIFDSTSAAVRNRAAVDALKAEVGGLRAVEYNTRGNIEYNRGNYYVAIDFYTDALQCDPNYAQAYIGRGATYYQRRDYDRAIADFTQAIRLEPNNASAYNWRGSAYNGKGDYDRAIADLTQAIRLEPTATSYNNRGSYYNNKGDYDRAIADCTEAIRLNANYAHPYRHRAYAYMQKGNFTQARADVNRALQIDPNYQNAQTLSAELRQRGY